MDTQAALTITRAGKTGRASRSLGQLWQVPTFLASLLFLMLVAATVPWRHDSAVEEFEEDLRQLREALHNKKERIDGSLSLAQSVLVRLGPHSRKAGQAHFLVGAIYQRLAEESPPDQAEAIRRQALTYLEQALAVGVPAEDSPALLFRLGQTLFASGAELERALGYMAQAVEHGTDQPARGFAMLVQGYLRLPTPNLEAALAANQRQLEYVEGADEYPARLVRGQILEQLGRRREAVQELEHIGAQAAVDIRLKARALQISCCEQEGLWNQAVPLWKDSLRDAGDPAEKRRILYSLGRACRKSDPADYKEAEAAWQKTVTLGGEEAQAADLRLAELHLSGPLADPGKGLSELTRALLHVQSSQDYQNTLVTLAQARTICETAWRSYQEGQEYERAETLASLYQKIAEPGQAPKRQAQTREARARELDNKAAKLGGAAATAWRQQARDYFRKAADAYEQAADARALDHQAALLRRSATCYQRAQEFRKALAVLKRFVQLNNSDADLAEAWLDLAEAYRDLGEKDDAREALFKCIEFPNTPFAYRARIPLAQEAWEKGELVNAENILMQNDPGSASDRATHASSLYLLGKLEFQRQKYHEASITFKKAITQYPDDARAFDTRDQLGVCYRKLADEVAQKLKDSKLTAEGRGYFKRTRHGFLEDATRTYQELADDLDKQGGAKPLPPAERALLRNADFQVADLRYEMEEIDEAWRRYQILFKKYRGELEGLNACGRIWFCANVILTTRPPQGRAAMEIARTVVQQAIEDIDRMGKDHEAFRAPNAYSQERWLTAVRDMKAKLDRYISAPQNSPTPPSPLMKKDQR